MHETGHPANPPLTSSPPVADIHVIVADDDALFRETTVALLAKAGYQVDGVGNADAVLARIGEAPVDVLITDVDMPGAQGLGYLRPIVDDEVNAPSVLIATAYPSIHSARVAFRLSAVDYLPKPFARSELLEAVERAVDRRASRALLHEVGARVDSVYDELTELRNKIRSSGGELDGDGGGERRTPRDGILRPTGDGRGGLPRSRATPVPPGGHGSRGVVPGLDLSPRENEIVELLRQGLRGSEIANALNLSPNTIRNHFKSIFRKAGVHSQVGLLALFRNA